MSMGTANFSRLFFAACCSTLLSALTALPQEVRFYPDVFREIKHDQSPPLSEIRPLLPESGARRVIPLRQLPRPGQNGLTQADSVLQNFVGSLVAPALLTNFDGTGQGLGSYTVTSAPPDTNGAVGPNHFVQIVNTDFAVFSKAGTVLYGPVPINTLWSGFSGGCEIDNDGDPIAQYDKLADRWVITQFAVTTTPYLQCVAVSQTSDPRGAYNRYSFMFSDFPDYPKLAVWPDAYYMTFNMFARTFSGGEVCALDRSKMLAGLAATMQCFNTGVNFFGLLTSDLDGKTSPAAGSPNYVVALDTTSTLAFWKFHVDWTKPANTTLTGPTSISVATYATACDGGTCIPQPGTQTLDSLADRLMYRFAYRNFGDHESLVVNHSVTAGAGAGVRWYELRSPNTSPTVFQQGTYAPADSNWRWMGSIAMDQAGDIAVGYSVSSGSIYPEIHFTGRLSTDPAGTMTQGEGTIIDGTGSQTGGLSRWGDYSSMAVDPADDCTFWYTNEYLKTTGSFNWSTRIASFKFPSCGGTPDFSILATPASRTVVQGNSTTYSVTVTPANGFKGTVNFSVSGLPSGATDSFNPVSVTGSGSSTLTVSTSTSTPTGSYPLTITGSSGSLIHTVKVTLVVNARATHFSVTAPAIATAGTSFSITVKALDKDNNVVTSYGGTVHFSSSDPAAVLPANSTLSSGVGTFTVTLKTAATQTITATDTSVGTINGSASIAVNPATATHFGIAAPPSTTAGTSFNLTVKALDAFGNVATGYTGTVHFTSTDPLAILPASSTLVSGVKTLTVTLKSAGTRTITATDTVVSTIRGSVNVTVKAASATHYALSAPASVTAGATFSVTVKALDAFGNVATGYTGTVHFTSTDPLAILPANSTLVSGAKTFSVTLKTKGTQTITATDTVNTTIRGSMNVSVI